MKRNHKSILAAGLLLALLGASIGAHADTKIRTSSFEYDASGLLVKEVIEPDNPNDCLQTSYSYDSYGNKSTVTASACAGATGYAIASAGTARVASTSFGVDGRFPVSSSNASGHSETRQHDARFGAPSSLVGPNGLATQWEYDGFGRKSKETRSDGTYTTWAYQFCTAAGANCPGPIGGVASVWVAIEQSYAANATSNGPEKRKFYDALNRAVREQSQGFDGVGPGTGPAIVQDTEYDALGRVARKSNQYKLAGGTAYWSSYSYDVLGRVIREESPDPVASGGVAVSTMSYSGLVTVVTNSKGQSKTTTKDAQGKVAQVTDAKGQTVSYSYDALGQLTQVNAAGAITAMTYNPRGQKISMVDPAMGAWEYRYNVFGELVWQRDSLGKAATIAYDVLGRMTQRTEADLVSQWSYDKKFDSSPCGKGVGKLCEAKADNGYKRTHSYDSLGRPASTATVLDNPSQPATVSASYDATTGRVASKTWPTGYQASYQYTASGYLQKVTGGGTAGFTQTVTFQVLAMDAQGHVTQYKQGSQVTTVRDYDDATGRLKSQTATRDTFASGGVVAQAYTYDSLGNLLTRVDNAPGVGTQESFSYDSLNRLNWYTVLGGGLGATQQTEVMYDARGNITYKSDVGRYWYDAQRPNRLTNITLETAPGALLANAGTRQLSYAFDDYLPGAQVVNGVTAGNGNLMYTVSQDTVNNRHTYRGEQYTSFNMPLSFVYSNFVNGTSTTADRTLSFVYGPEHQRIKQQVELTSNAPTSYSAGVTWYLNGEDGQGLSYEKEIKASGVTEHKHYVSAGGVTFALFTSRAGTQTNSTIRYLYHDHLGSLVAISDEVGQVVERLAYDPWGKRRNVDGTQDVLDSIVGWNSDRGYTMHEHLDEMGIIHMNGRVYDPLIGRFMSADPFIQAPDNLQSHNRYSYVLNNPLAFTDPSGYFSWRKVFRAVVAIAVAVFAPEISAYIGWTGGVSASGAAIAGGASASLGLSGAAASGALGGALAGAVTTGTVKGAVIGAVTGGALGAVGDIAPSGIGNVAGHAAVGCASAAASGGDCGSGALAGAAGSVLSNSVVKFESLEANVVAHAVVGGVAAELGGGKFENGATTAAFGYLFNAGGHGMVAKGIRGFASLVSDVATGNFQLAAPEVWGRTGSGERFRADGVFVHGEDGRTMLGGAVVVCEVKCGPTAELSARQVRVYDAISRNDFYLEGPRAASVAAQAGLTVNAAGHLRIPQERFGGTYLGVYEGSAAHLKPGGQKINWGAIFGGSLRGND